MREVKIFSDGGGETRPTNTRPETIKNGKHHLLKSDDDDHE